MHLSLLVTVQKTSALLHRVTDFSTLLVDQVFRLALWIIQKGRLVSAVWIIGSSPAVRVSKGVFTSNQPESHT